MYKTIARIGLALLTLCACEAKEELRDGMVPELDRSVDHGPSARDASPGDGTVDASPFPENGWIVWQSNREDGRSEIYLMQADGSSPRRLTRSGGQMPLWSPDGRWIVYQSLVDNAARLIKPDGTGDRELYPAPPWFWMPDNSGVLCGDTTEFVIVDPDSGKKRSFFSVADFPNLANKVFQPMGITGDLRYVVAGSDRYRGGFAGDNGYFTAPFAAVILDLQQKEKLFFFGSGCAPRTAPWGTIVYHVCGDCPTKPDIYRMDLADIATRSSYRPEVSNPDPDWGHEYFPQISNDNQWMVYGASTGCHDQANCDYEIFLHRLGAKPQQRYRVTSDTANDVRPSLYIGELALP